MTSAEKTNITKLRLSGASYHEIAANLRLPEGTVKSFCRRNHLQKQASAVPGVCKHCGQPLAQIPKQKPKQCCSDACRLKWWNTHRNQISRKSTTKLHCRHCGAEFESYDAGRKYCSHSCYIAARYGKVRSHYDT